MKPRFNWRRRFSSPGVLTAAIAAVALSLVLLRRAHPVEAEHATAYRQARASAHNEEEARRLNNLGTAYMARQDFESGLKQFQRAASLDPNLSEAVLNEAIALLNSQKFDAAGSALLKFTQDHPESARAWYNLGLLDRSQGDFTNALDAFHHVVKLEPQSADAWYFVGVSQDDLHDERASLDALERALKLNPLHASAEFATARAEQRLGDTEKAKQHFNRFQELTQRKLSAPLSLTYGDQGELSLAAQSGTSVQQAPAQIPVKFIDVTRSAGLPAANTNQLSAGTTARPHGACWLDFDGDGRPDLLLTSAGVDGHAALLRNRGDSKFEDVTSAEGLRDIHGAQTCAAGDFDNDGRTDFALGFPDRVELYRNTAGKFKNVTAAAGLAAAESGARSLLWIDFDHDGDLDLFVVGAAGATAMFRNNGNGTFTNVSSETGLAFDHANSGVLTDYNNDRAVDLILTGAKTLAVTNPREGKWLPSQPWSSGIPPSTALAVADFNKDGWMDLVATHPSAPAVSVWRNDSGRGFAPYSSAPTATDLAEARGVVVFDYDNDGWLDFAVVGLTGDGKGAIRLFRNLGRDGFRDVTRDTGLDGVGLHDPEGIYAADFDGDGSPDLLVTESDGRVVLLRNVGANANHFLRVSLVGLNDNKSAIGTKVEVFAGATSQKFEIGSGSYLGQSTADLLVGLGKETKADVVRLLWPTGVPQDEIEAAAGQTHKISELDRRGSSCPILFAWDGARYRFVSDMLGAGVLGHWIGPGQRNIPRPVEYLKIEGFVPQKRDGNLSLRFMEPLEEVVYLDQVRLLAIDHPAALEVYPNEYFASNPPYPEYKVIASRDARPPAAAWDGRGRDVLLQLLSRDHRYVTGFDLLPFKGFTRPHSLELDLGHAYTGGPLQLIMHGYIEYFTATSMFAANQAGIEPFAPYVEALDTNGKWVRVVDDMGFPAGLPRTTVADLSGKLPKGTRRIRLTTNLQIYWDQILIDCTPQSFEPRTTELPLASARLDLHGFPRSVEGRTPGDVDYVYENPSKTGPFNRPVGAYTRTGEVRDLVAARDDRFAVFGSGDEIQLEFNPNSLPALPAGWKRDYFFFAAGYEKDMDFYAADGLTVAPLPFQEMAGYPYSETNSNTPAPRWNWNDLLNLNTRMFSDVNPTSYRYHYAPNGNSPRAHRSLPQK